MEIKAQIEKPLDQIFLTAKENGVPFADRGYAMVESIPDDCILFVGLNPSYPDGSKEGSHFYSLNQDHGGYFAKFKDIAKTCGEDTKWGHFDLLAVRETKQEQIGKLEQSNLDFIWDQLDKVARPVLASIKPKAVVVVNTMARKYLGKDKVQSQNIWLGFNFEFNESNGAYYIKDAPKNLDNVPFFFSGMLTGQRALDLGSLERLKWHVGKVLNEKKRN
ncbi:MAG: hypothetical protein JJU02_16075 [Cryomorphaceae bacterium]|nr:hypothetical protein [Cryomorphaceae bacterium]